VQPFEISSLPGVSTIIDTVLRLVLGRALVYPNSTLIRVDQRWRDRLLPPPIGLLHVRLHRARNVGSILSLLGSLDRPDPYVRFGIEGHGDQWVRSSTKANAQHPEWGEDFFLVVRDPAEVLTATLVDDNFGILNDRKIAAGDFSLVRMVGRPGVWFQDTVRTRTGRAAEDDVSERSDRGVPAAKGPAARSFGSLRLMRGMTTVENKVRLRVRMVSDKPLALELSTRFLPVLSPDRVREMVWEGTSKAGGGDADEASGDGGEGPPAKRRWGERKGILFVDVVQCQGLVDKTVDPMVRVNVLDPERGAVQAQTRVEMNTENPVFHESFSFANVHEASTLLLEVVDKNLGLVSKFTKLIKFKSPRQRKIGEVVVPVRDVAKNGQMQEELMLDKVERGTITLKLKWEPIFIDHAALPEGVVV